MADYTSGMIALIPSEADLDRLVVDGGEPRDELHLTIAYLGDDVTGWDEEAVSALHSEVQERINGGPIEARVMGHAVFNTDGGPDGDRDPCAVHLVGDTDRLAPMRADFAALLGHKTGVPQQHEPFIPHITGGYNMTIDALAYTGPITFDRVRVALGNNVTDYPLGGTKETDMPEQLVDNPNGIPVTFPVLAVEGISTSDGRYIDAGALTTRPLPLPILAQTETPDGGSGHDGAYVIGRLDTAVRVPGPTVVSRVTGKPFPEGTFVWQGTGHIDPEHAAANLVQRGYLTGNSVDLSEIEAFIETDPNHVDLDDSDEGGVKIGGSTGERVRLTKGTIAATTLVAIPAFADAYVLVDGKPVTPAEGLAAAAAPAWRASELGDPTCLPCALNEASLTASAEPALPPIAWFRDPELPAATPLQVNEDGRVFGHLAAWNTCHTSFTNQCVLAPKSGCDYAYFRTGARRALSDTGDPVQISIGKLTVVLDTDKDGHANPKLGVMPAAAHYDNAATAVADVEIGEDAYGIWVAGAVRPTATREQIDALMASTLSGDWRPVNGRLELVAALAVNTPGYPIPRARVASGEVLSLVAAGAVPRQTTEWTPALAAWADHIADTVVAKLGVRVPQKPDDDTATALAARKAAALAELSEADLEHRWSVAAGKLEA